MTRRTITFDLIAHLERQREFSLRTFGPGARNADRTTKGSAWPFPPQEDR